MKELFLLPLLVGNGASVLPELQTRSNPCPYTGVAAPSAETRPIRQQNPDFSFQIPQNYRAFKNAYPQNGVLINTIAIVDEASHAFSECIERVGPDKIPNFYEKYGLDGDLFPSIVVSYRAGDFKNTWDLIKAVFSNIEGIEPLGWTTVAGQKALIYLPPSASHTVDVSFISPNGKSLITLSSTAKLRFERRDEIGENGSVYPVDHPIVEGVENGAVFQNILNSFTFTDSVNTAITNDIEDIIKVKNFFKKQDVGNSYPYYIEKVFSSDQPYPLYIISEQFPFSRGAINCYRGNGEDRLCPSFAYIPKGTTYQEVWGVGMGLDSTVRLSSKRLNKMPCIETVERQKKTTYCYDGKQYKTLAFTRQ